MKTICKFIFIVLFYMILVHKGESFYTDEELGVIRTLGTLSGIKRFTFIQNSNNIEVMRQIKVFPQSQLFSLVTNSRELDLILNDDFRKNLFFEKRAIFVTKEDLNYTDVLEKLSGIRSVTWIVFVESFHEMKNFYIPINTNFFIVHFTSDIIIINKVYNIKPGLHTSSKIIGIWSKNESEESYVVSGDKKINFEEKTLNLLFFFNEKECTDRGPKHILDRIECFHQEMVKIMAERLNFKINRVECTERQYPYNFPNGTLSELFIALYKKEADFSSGSYIISNHRLTYYDFAWPTFTTKSLMYIKFRSTKNHWRAYLKPIDSKVWKAIAFWIIITGFLIQLSKELRKRNFKISFSVVPEIIKSIFLSLQVFCNQGLHNMSKKCSSRIIFMLTFLLFVSLYQAYSGFLISFLTVSIADIPFLNFNGFLRDGTYKVMTLRRGFHNYYVKKIFMENEDKRRNLLIKDEDLPFGTNHGIEKLCSMKKLAYVEFRENIVQYNIPCKITEIPEPLLYQTLGLGFPKNSPYKEIINQQLNLLRSTGILNRMNSYLLSYVTLKQKEVAEEQYKYVKIKHVVSLFVLLGGGIVISIIVLLLEIMSKFLNNFISNKRKIKRTKLKCQRSSYLYI